MQLAIDFDTPALPVAQAMGEIGMKRALDHAEAENLEWCTQSENRLHSYRVLLTRHPSTGKFGVLHHASLPITGICISSGERRDYPATDDVRKDGFAPKDASACAAGAQKSHKGWMWFRPGSVPRNPLYAPTRNVGPKNPAAHAVVCVAPNGLERAYDCARSAVADGFSEVGISHVLTGRQKTHGGCVWRLAATKTTPEA